MLSYRKTTPLCFLPCGKLVCYKAGWIQIILDDKIVKKIKIPTPIMERLFGFSNLLYRFFRMGIRAAVAIDDYIIIISRGGMLYEVNLNDGSISHGFLCDKGVRPLMFTQVENISNFENGIYFGGYLQNNSKKPVFIYKRTGQDRWSVIYTFPDGVINHIHTIITDPYRDCLWIFTGDFGNSAAIWRVKDNFRSVECLCSANQKYRGCVAFAVPEGLIYATDSPFEDNYIYILDPEKVELNPLKSINGSCIYGAHWGDKYVFSTTVEGDGRNLSLFDFLFSRDRGHGIKDEYVHIYSGNIKEGFKEIYKEKKDRLPFYTFQFGVFRFPSGINNTQTLYFQPVATKRNDLSLMGIN